MKEMFNICIKAYDEKKNIMNIKLECIKYLNI